VYYYEPEGVVQIYPDYSAYTSPEVEYYFYKIDGDQSEPLQLSDLEDGFTVESGNFEAKLPVGVYHVIATNTGASNVEFTGSESYETFIAKADPDPANSREGYTLILQPDSVYSIVIEDLEVVDKDTIRREPLPTLLTKQLNLEFTMGDGLKTGDVSSLTGILPGIYPAVHLYTGEGRNGEGGELGQSPVTTAVNFETVTEGSDKRKAKILHFGVLDPEPEEGEGYTNILELTLRMADNTLYTTTKDISQHLSAVLKGGGSLQITLEKTPFGVVAEVEPWTEEGEDEIED
jgi:hypothetical protein